MTDDTDKWLKSLSGDETPENTADNDLKLASSLGHSLKKEFNQMVKNLENQPDEKEKIFQRLTSRLQSEGLLENESGTQIGHKESVLGSLAESLKDLILGSTQKVEAAFADDGSSIQPSQDLYELVIDGKVQVSIQINIDSQNKEFATIIAHFSQDWLDNPANKSASDHGVCIYAGNAKILEGKIIDGELSAVIDNYSTLPVTKQWLIIGKNDSK